MSTSKLFRAGSGFVGDVTRKGQSMVESAKLGASGAPTAFGVPVKFDSAGQLVAIEASDAATVFKGILARVVPEMSGSLASGFSDETPNADFMQALLVEGYMNVLCPQGTPVRGGQVFMRITAVSGKAVGDFETTASGGECVAITGLTFASNGKDANNICEVRLL